MTPSMYEPDIYSPDWAEDVQRNERIRNLERSPKALSITDQIQLHNDRVTRDNKAKQRMATMEQSLRYDELKKAYDKIGKQE